MSLDSILSSTLENYKKNFKSSAKIILLFIIIPMLIVNICTLWWLMSSGISEELKSLQTGEDGNLPEESVEIFLNILKSNIPAILGVSFLYLAAFLISFIAYAGIIGASLKNKEFSFSEAKNNGKENWGKIFRIFLLIASFFAAFFIMILILFSIFSKSLGSILFLIFFFFISLIFIFIITTYWIFAPYIAIDKKMGAYEALARSRAMIKGRLWKTLGYLIVFIFIGMIVSFGINLVGSIVQMILLFLFKSSITPNSLIVLTSLVSSLVSSINHLIILPYYLLVIKNYYNEVCRGKKNN
ncbi:MAG: hypothetical protein AABW65_02620 [Nanoarchaeota archaeon]